MSIPVHTFLDNNNCCLECGYSRDNIIHIKENITYEVDGKELLYKLRILEYLSAELVKQITWMKETLERIDPPFIGELEAKITSLTLMLNEERGKNYGKES